MSSISWKEPAQFRRATSKMALCNKPSGGGQTVWQALLQHSSSGKSCVLHSSLSLMWWKEEKERERYMNWGQLGWISAQGTGFIFWGRTFTSFSKTFLTCSHKTIKWWINGLWNNKRRTFLFMSRAFVCKAHWPAAGHQVHKVRNVRLRMSNAFARSLAGECRKWLQIKPVNLRLEGRKSRNGSIYSVWCVNEECC